MPNRMASCKIEKIDEQDIEKFHEMSRVLNILGNKKRIAILAVIKEHKEVCACELQPALGMPQPTITSHLRKMYDIGILKQKEVWKYSYYFISPKYRSLVNDILKDQTGSIPSSTGHETETEEIR